MCFVLYHQDTSIHTVNRNIYDPANILQSLFLHAYTNTQPLLCENTNTHTHEREELLYIAGEWRQISKREREAENKCKHAKTYFNAV